MHLRAFIPSSKKDYPIAILCAERVRHLGWHPWILVTEREWPCGAPNGTIICDYDREGWGMYGNWCAYNIVRTMQRFAPDGVAMKLDADVALLEQGSEYLGQVEDKARCLRLSGYPAHKAAWGGIWSAKGESLPQMAHALQMSRACRCAESALVLSCATKSIGLEVAPTLCAQVWPPAGDTHATGCLTLPIKTARQTRLQDAASMFDFRA